MDCLLSIDLPNEPGSAPRARDMVESLDGLPAGVQSDVKLLIHELVANAVRHGCMDDDDSVRVVLFATPDEVLGIVWDEGLGAPPRLKAGTENGGFGLRLVNDLSYRWGVARCRGSGVWFRLGQPSQSPLGGGHRSR